MGGALLRAAAEAAEEARAGELGPDGPEAAEEARLRPPLRAPRGSPQPLLETCILTTMKGRENAERKGVTTPTAAQDIFAIGPCFSILLFFGAHCRALFA